jgi:hypothetical protein
MYKQEHVYEFHQGGAAGGATRRKKLDLRRLSKRFIIAGIQHAALQDEGGKRNDGDKPFSRRE